MLNTLRVVRPLMEQLAQCDGGNVIALQNLSEKIKPFLSLKLIGTSLLSDTQADIPVFSSGQATITYVIAGQAAYSDSTGKQGLLKQGGLSWLLSGSGVWTRLEPVTDNYLAIELRVALAPALENSPPQTAWLDADVIEREGPAHLFIGWHGESRGNFTLPSLMNYALVNLRARQDWHYQMPANHTCVWIFVISGALATASGEVLANRIALLDGINRHIHLRATADTVFVIGSSQEFDHDLITHNNSVHTSRDALRLGTSRLAELEQTLSV